MPDTAEQTRLKAMTAAATEPLLSDLEIDNLLTQFSIVDADGYDPTEVGWTPTYNLRAAACEGWRWWRRNVDGNKSGTFRHIRHSV